MDNENNIKEDSKAITFELHSANEPRIYEKDDEWFYEQGVANYPFQNILINLTKMYGKGNEPKTVEEFCKCFPPLAYPSHKGEKTK